MTPALKALRDKFQAGAVVSGSSAGAASQVGWQATMKLLLAQGSVFIKHLFVYH